MQLIQLILFFIVGVSITTPISAWLQHKENIQFNQITFSGPSNGWLLASTRNFSFIFCSTDSGKSWQKQYETRKGIYKIKFFDEKIGWGIGQEGLIIHTTDGGTNWVQQNSKTEEKLNSLGIVNQNTVYVIGDNGVLLNTQNKGATWTPQKLNTNLPLQNIYFIDENIGYIAAITHFFQTKDAGKTWERKDIAYKERILSITFLNKSTGWISTDSSLFKTEDEGENWQRIYVDKQGYISGPTFPNSQCGWLAKSDGEDGSIIHAKENNEKKSISYILSTSDGGNSWKQQLAITSNKDHGAWILDIFFIDTNNGWAVGRDNLMLTTTDGGQTWKHSNKFLTDS